ncbi:MAG: Na+/H+ antiporter NhaC [Fretibacterium sp.]|nr:Na+/H+ antiporter NhaC [Fretibacterium sp.]
MTDKEKEPLNTKDKLSEGRSPSFLEAALVILVAAIAILSAVQIWETDVHIPLVFATIVATLLAMFRMKVSWSVIEDAFLSSITLGMQAILILYTVGMLIGVWILSGVVPSMIYYGLNTISPSIFLIATLLICSIVSLATGTSWGTSGTVGIALLGIGSGLGIPSAMCAGFIISGAYFGDKMSPLSDTTNLAPAMAGSDLFQHIRAMCWTTIPTYIIVLVIAGIMGNRYSQGTLNIEQIEALQALMSSEFSISLWNFIPPLIVIGLAASKKPAIPSIAAGMLAGCALALLQGAGLGTLLDILQNGYTPGLASKIAEAAADSGAIAELLKNAGLTGVTPEAAVTAANTLKELLAKGGLQSMNWTVSLILCALTFGGILDRCGFLEVLLSVLLKKVKTVGGLVTSVVISCLMTNIFTGDQYVALVLPGRMFKNRFDQSGLHPRMLSRSLEDCGTLTSALVPWNTCGAFQSKALGIPTLEYLPYAFLNYLNPIVAVLMTYMGLGIAWRANNAEGFVISRAKPEDN